MQSRVRQRSRNKKRDITLMTLLAFESKPEAENLLKKYGKDPSSNSCTELENKLVQLYYSVSDKPTLEKEMAQIHPHKNWLIKTLPELNSIRNESGGTAQTKLDDIEKEASSSFDSPERETKKCNCPKCRERKSNCCGADGQYSSLDGSGEGVVIDKRPSLRASNGLELIALVAIAGIVFYSLKNK